MKLKFDNKLFALAALALTLHAADGRAGAPSGRFAKSTGIVTDTKTGLIWQQPASSATYTAIAANAYCTGRGTGWRVPTAKELLTLVDTTTFPSATTTTTIDTDAFSGTPVDKSWWSSNALSVAPSRYWAFEFGGHAALHSEDGSTPLYVRCVK